jgi:hypothetical protein
MYIEEDTCSNESKSNVLGIELGPPRRGMLAPDPPDIDVESYHEEDEQK